MGGERGTPNCGIIVGTARILTTAWHAQKLSHVLVWDPTGL